MNKAIRGEFKKYVKVAYFIDNQTDKDIAAKLGVSINCVKEVIKEIERELDENLSDK